MDTGGFADDAIRAEDKFTRHVTSLRDKLVASIGADDPRGKQLWAELNAQMREVRQMTGDAEVLRSNMSYGDKTPDRVGREMGQLPYAQAALDIWSGQQTPPTGFEFDNAEQFLQSRIDKTLADTKTSADDASADAPSDIRFIRSGLETDSAQAATRRERGVETLDDYRQLVTEMSALLSAMDGLRDPKNLVGLHPNQRRDLPLMATRLDADIAQAREYFADLRSQGVDSQPFEDLAREQFAKHGAEAVLNLGEDFPRDLLDVANAKSKAYHDARKDGKPGTAEGLETIAAVRDLLGSGNANVHTQIAPAVNKLVAEQIAANGGSVSPALRELLSDPVWGRYGVFNGVLSRMAMEDLIAGGQVDDLRTATNGRYAAVEWENAPRVSPDLVVDDRKTASSVEADVEFRDGIEQVTPNVSSALNAMFSAHGGGIHRTYNNVAELDHEDGERMRRLDAMGQARQSGADVRSYGEIGGIYAKSSNLVVVADSTLNGWERTNVVVHELGHALDSMLGEMIADGTWFTDHDPQFQEFHDSIKKTASYGDDPNDSIMYRYFRDASEGSISHNGKNGHYEVFAEGYAAYTAGLRSIQEMGGGEITADTTHMLIGQALTKNEGKNAELAGKLTYEQRREREVAIGRSIMGFFGDLEENRLPALMEAGPRPMPVNSELRHGVIGVDLVRSGAPTQQRATPSQKTKADTHNSRQHGVIAMQPVQRGSPEWAQMETAVKQASPGASLPSPTALYVTWNPDFASQGVSVIWKAVMPGQDKPTTEYTDQHKATQLAAKFQRQQRVNEALDEAHSKAEAAAAYDETAALVLAMIETGMRVGSSEKAGSVDRKTGKKVPTFGGATMQAKHVFFPSDTLMRFKFPGKAGKQNVYESRNPVLRAAVQQLIEGKKPSDQVFAGTNSGRTIDYIRTATGIDDIINHDTRTRYATNLARELVAKVPKSKMPKNEAAFKKWQSGISKTVGIAINDTWQVARDSYISPAVWEPLEDSAGLPHSFDDSPPYGLIEGGVVTTLVPGAPGGPPLPAQVPGITPGEAPAPVAAAAESADAEPQAHSLDHSPTAVAERQAWYGSFVWPDPPIVAGPDTTFEAEDGGEG